MKLYCLEYDSEIQLVADAEGRKIWIDWLSKKQPITIPASPYAGVPLPLPDFAHTNISGLGLSARAASVLGEEQFILITDLAIAGYEGYRIGIPALYADEIFAKQGVHFLLPLRLKNPLGQIPTGMMTTGGQFTGVAGSFFVSEDLWQRIESAGLTGLHLAAVYEVTPST